MPGMYSGLNARNAEVVAAFRAALVHQGLLAALIFAVLGATWLGLRAYSRAQGGTAAGDVTASRGGTADRGGPAEPAGRKVLAIGFGNLWLFDGLLQAQPQMALGLPALVIEPGAATSPHWVQHLINWAGTAWTYHPMQAGAAAVWIQVGLGIWLLAAPYGPLSRLAGLASAGWGLTVWVFGEAFGGIFAPGQSWAFGAPGAALIYVAAGALIALPDRAWRSRRLGRLTLAGLGLLLAGMAILQAWPGRGTWYGISHGQSGSLAGMALSMSQTPQPGFLSGWLLAFGTFDQAHGFAVNLVMTAVLAATGGALLSGRPWLIRPALACFGALSLADWVLVQDLGFLGGLGTDPNSMIPFLLLAGGGYLALTRVAALPVPDPAASSADTAAASRATRARPAVVARQAGAATGWSVAAVGGACLVVLGAVPMAVAQASPNADPILAQSISGPAVQVDYPAPGFSLTDQNGRTVTLAGLRGKVVLLAFVDQGCATGCPPVGRELSQAVALLGASARNVTLAAIALPGTGRPPATGSARTGPDGLGPARRWLDLTGNAAQVSQVRRRYGVAPPGPGAATSDEARVFVIDPAGRVRAAYRTGSAEATAAIISSFAVLFADAARQALRAG